MVSFGFAAASVRGATVTTETNRQLIEGVLIGYLQDV